MLTAQDWHTRFTQQAEWTAPLRRYLYERIDLGGVERVIEVGCGTGALLGELVSKVRDESHGVHLPQVYGLDMQAGFLSLARLHAPDARLTLADAHQIPYATDCFDLAACHFTLLWVDEPGQVIAEMKRLVKPGGAVLVLAEPDYGGRIDYPDDLSQLGIWQEEALSRQGAHTRLGRRLGAILNNAGLVEVETGLLGGQWRSAPSLEEWQSEWRVMHADLDDHVDTDRLLHLKELDRQASLSGSRVLYVPTFYAWGKVHPV
jgi:SAM-dependent methyltransferase